MASITKGPLGNTRRRSQGKTMELYQTIADTAGALRKYQEVPRLRFQAALGFLIMVFSLGSYFAVNLFMESRIGLAGREILLTQMAITDARLFNEDLRSQISTVLSNRNLRERALSMGFVESDPAEITYIAVTGYAGKPSVDLSNKEMKAANTTLRPEYTESLLTWLSAQLEQASRPLKEQ